MAAVPLRKDIVPIKTSPAHPAAVALSPKAEAAKAKLETGYRRVQAPEWLMSVIACFRPQVPPRTIVVMYWLTDGNEASACVWEVPGTNTEEYC